MRSSRRRDRLADTADNYAVAATLPLPATMHTEQLRTGMERIAAELKQLYVAMSGDDPWNDSDSADLPPSE